jgi:predicted HicB family RNase H-like nuclease
MTIQLDLAPDVERGLLAQAERHGVSLEQYVEQIITRKAYRTPSAVAAAKPPIW